MRLTQLTDYALRLLMYLGQNRERLCTIAEVAAHHQISEAHLMKVTHLLAKGGWIQTQRGKNGGMRLAKAPRDIRLGELVRYTETDLDLVECLGGGNRCVISGHCGLGGILRQALQQFMDHLDGYSLQDLLPQPGGAVHPIRLDLMPASA